MRLGVIGLMILMLIGCHNETISIIEEPAPSQDIAPTQNGIELSLETTTFEGPPETIVATLVNESDTDCEYGDFFSVEINQEGYWHIINYPEYTFTANPCFIDLSRKLNAGESVTQLFEPQEYGLILPEGEYRLTKTVRCPFPRGSETTVAVSFEVIEVES